MKSKRDERSRKGLTVKFPALHIRRSTGICGCAADTGGARGFLEDTCHHVPELFRAEAKNKMFDLR